MVISSFGLDVPEAELRRLCDCTFDGTSSLKAVEAARQLGFANTTKHTLSSAELEALVADGKFPIVFIDLTPIDGVYQAHALVVIGVSQFAVQVLDPARGERLIPCDVFYPAWKMRHNLAILVEP